MHFYGIYLTCKEATGHKTLCFYSLSVFPHENDLDFFYPPTLWTAGAFQDFTASRCVQAISVGPVQ